MTRDELLEALEVERRLPVPPPPAVIRDINAMTDTPALVIARRRAAALEMNPAARGDRHAVDDLPVVLDPHAPAVAADAVHDIGERDRARRLLNDYPEETP